MQRVTKTDVAVEKLENVHCRLIYVLMTFQNLDSQEEKNILDGVLDEITEDLSDAICEIKRDKTKKEEIEVSLHVKAIRWNF